MSTLSRPFFVVAGLAFSLPAVANDDVRCGMISHRASALVECLNPHDSPGPYAPPPLSFLIEQDASGVTAVLDNGITVDVDLESDGSLAYAVDGHPSDVTAVEDVLDANLSVEEQAAVSEALQPASLTTATDELVLILGE
ncbi:MAG: hypothetical protein CL927_02415 [Deltaproteobacteria bacterium]|nr:hypothetical protein [Deltaproteobacteria bacterium]HCH64650.1 hypothetical protein [Deltaproteobacteria bacterium]|tara:strand:- start:302 stop:721 length:420 start_codon:yes stop_codon:yes gene_type:complete